MNPRVYKPVGDRHRVLTALERYWEKHPSDDLTQLIARVTDEPVRDETLLRRINREIR